jgi:hypothetical protein
MDLRITQGIDNTDLLRRSVFYAPEKANFLANTVRTATKGSGDAVSVCRVGFSAGHEALSALAVRPDTKVYAFETDESPSTVPAHDILDERFPSRLFLYLGDASVSIPRVAAQNRNLLCDVVYISSTAPEHVVRTALYDMASLTSPRGHVVILDVPADQARARAAQAAWVASEDRGELETAAVLRSGVHKSFAQIIASGGALLDEFVVGTYSHAHLSATVNARAQ